MKRLGPILILTALAIVWTSVSQGQRLQFFSNNHRSEIEPREHNNVVYYPLREVARIFSLPWQERSQEEFLLRGPRGSITFFRDKNEIRVNGEIVALNRSVWRRRGEQWFVTSDFFEAALPRILEVQLNRRSATVFDVQSPAPVLEVKIQISLFSDHTRLTLEPAQPADFQTRDTGGAVEITAPNRRLRATLPAPVQGQSFVGRITFDASGAGTLRVDKGPAFQSRRELTLENPFRKVVDFYGPPAVPSTPPPLPAPARTETPVLPPVVVSPPVTSPALQRQKFVPRPTKDIIVLDAGHGGPDLGAHPSTELLEKNFALALAQQTKTEIEGLSMYKVVITREQDVALGTLQRTAVANAYRAEAFVSLHFGGSYDPGMHGPKVYYYAAPLPAAADAPSQDNPSQELGTAPATASRAGVTPWKSAQVEVLARSQSLAANLQARLNLLFESPDTQVGSNQFLVVQGSLSPAVIVEAGYLTNPADAQFLSQAENLKKLARAIAAGILDFLQGQKQ